MDKTMKDKAEALRTAQDMFIYTKEMLQSLYDKPIPFVLLYMHDRSELLTNIDPKNAKRFLERATEQMSKPPQHI